MAHAPPPYSCTRVRTSYASEMTSSRSPPADRRMRTVRPSLGRASSHHVFPPSACTHEKPTAALATSSALKGDIQLPHGATRDTVIGDYSGTVRDAECGERGPAGALRSVLCPSAGCYSAGSGSRRRVLASVSVAETWHC